MSLKLTLAALALSGFLTLQAAVTFTTQPSISYNASSQRWNISFAVSEYTDVEVTILRQADSGIVRRFAAGRLGATPPAPFTANSLSQTLVWDGRDELGNPVASSEGLRVRVRAGLSVSLDKIVDQNPYYFRKISGLSRDDNGNVYVYGSYGSENYNMTLRQYDANGNYVRTAVPFAAGLDTSHLAGWGLNIRSDNRYCLKYQQGYNHWLAGLAYHPVAMGDGDWGGGGVLLKPFTIENKAFFTRGNNFFLVSAEGGISAGGEVPLITSPATGANGGPQFYTKSPDGNSIFISGAYSYTGGYQEVHNLNFTGFWRDGAVYRLNLSTGVVTLWHTFIPSDSIPDLNTAARNSTVGPAYEGDWPYPMNWAAIHGITFDDSGHVYICDRVRSRIGIYDTATFELVGSIPVSGPHMVEVNRANGEIYVLSQQLLAYWSGEVSIRKFASWRNPTLLASRLNFLTSLPTNAPLQRFFVVYGSGNPCIWLSQTSVYLFRDDGDTLVLTKNFSDLCPDEQAARVPTLYERIAVDRRNERVYVNNSWSGFFQITDWNAPKALACTTSTGQRLWAGEAVVSPDGFLYARTGSGYAGPLMKYTTDLYPAPVNFKGSNEVHNYLFSKKGVAFGDLGLAAGRDGRVYWMEMGELGFRRGAVVESVDPDSSFRDSLVLIYDPCYTGSCSNPGGLKVDYDGNIYIGYSVRPSDHVIPAGFVGDAGYREGVGALYKLPPFGTQILAHDVTGLTAYPQGLGVFSPNGPCACRTPRFDLDPWGRLFIPNAITSEVAIADNAGNTLLKFGEYGNIDSKGAGSLVPGPAIPLASPLDVAASDNYIYISDWLNARLVRVKMDFALQNLHLPQTSIEQDAAGRRIELSASPNPFNPESRIRVFLPVGGQMVLSVYGVDGRLIRMLASGQHKAGAYNFVWNARDDAGKSVSAGVYAYRLSAGKRVLMQKVILAK